MNMVTLPFLALVLLLIVAFFMGVVIGATLKGPSRDIDNKEGQSIKPGEYLFRLNVTEDQLKDSRQLGADKVVLDFDVAKPPIKGKINFIPPHDPLIIDTKKTLDQNHLKPKLDIENDLSNLREWRNRKTKDKND
jgi:hypothetical protein